jgi:hypothetical protein
MADVVPHLAPRSQGINGARELVGWQSQINKWDMCYMYGSFSVTPEYTRTFHQNRITESLFCDALTSGSNSYHNSCHHGNNDCGNKILIQGTKVVGRNAKALMAENFYLPTDYSSEITFNPVVQNFLVDFNYYQGLDEWVEGMYCRIHTPITWTQWRLNYHEHIIDKGSQPMDPGYFNDTYSSNATGTYGLSRSSLLKNFGEYVSDYESIEGVTNITYDPLQKARWNKCSMSKTGLAEITAAFGWNFVRHENVLFGLNLRAAAPTGNRPHGTYLFEPMVGNGQHWELGGGMNLWCTCWKSCDEQKNFTMYMDAYATHMFKTRQCRTFDLVGKPLSRYMLAMKFSPNVSNLLAGADPDSATAPLAQFTKEFTPVANLTTIPVDVSYAAQGEVILKFAYTHCNFQWDIGYDFWGRTCAKIRKRCDCCDNGFATNVWGLKGDAFAFGFPETGGEGSIPTNAAIPLSATESGATIFGGTNNYYSGIDGIFWNQNPGIDNATQAWEDTTTILATYASTPISSGWAHVDTSAPSPVLLTQDSIDTCAARTKAYSNKLFTHFGYLWKEHECWTPYLGLGGEVEFGSQGNYGDDNCHHKSNCHENHKHSHGHCNGNENRCSKFAFSQWGIWLKGGFSFN